MSNVFIVESGCVFEGGGVLEVFDSEGKARSFCLGKAKQAQDNTLKNRKCDPETFDTDWSETKSNFWSDGFDYFMYRKMAVR